jgi:nucleoredoxin
MPAVLRLRFRFSRQIAAWLFLLGLVGTAGAVSRDPAELRAQRERWPSEITVTSAARGVVLQQGKPNGAMLLGAGRTLAVIDVADDGVVGRIGSVTLLVAFDKTDFFSRFQPAGAAPVAPAPARSAPPAAAPEDGPPAKKSAPAAGGTEGRSNAMMPRLLGDKLVQFTEGRVRPAPAGSIDGARFIALYYSASWCGPCRQFTPELVKAYRELKAKYPDFEVVFVSSDNSAGEMADYMKKDAMPWLAVDYAKRNGKIMSYSGPGIPCLVLVDEKGKVLSDSFEGDNYVGPMKVLNDARRLLAKR